MTVREQRTLTIGNVRGLHARAASKFCTLSARFDCEITVTGGGVTVGGCSLMALLMLGAAKGSEITVEAVGPDAKEAIAALEELVTARFGEPS